MQAFVQFLSPSDFVDHHIDGAFFIEILYKNKLPS